MLLVRKTPGHLRVPTVIGWKVATFITLATFGFIIVMICLA